MGACSAVENLLVGNRGAIDGWEGEKGKKKRGGEEGSGTWNGWTLIICINANIQGGSKTGLLGLCLTANILKTP